MGRALAQPGWSAVRRLTGGRQRAQVLVLMAVLIPLVLVPIAAYAAEAGYAASRAAVLEWACTRAAEDAAQELDANALRANAVLQVDPTAAADLASRQVSALDPRAVVDEVTTAAATVSVLAHEDVPATLAFWIAGGRLRVRGSATARLVPGYASPSSALPFSTSSFWVAASDSSSEESSSRQREGLMNG